MVKKMPQESTPPEPAPIPSNMPGIGMPTGAKEIPRNHGNSIAVAEQEPRKAPIPGTIMRFRLPAYGRMTEILETDALQEGEKIVELTVSSTEKKATITFI